MDRPVELLTHDEEVSYILIALRHLSEDFHAQIELYNTVVAVNDLKYRKFLSSQLTNVNSIVHKLENQRSLCSEFNIQPLLQYDIKRNG